MSSSAFIAICLVTFVAVYVVYSIYEHKHPPVPAGLKMLPEDQRDALRPHEREFFSRWADEECVKDFCHAVDLYSGDKTGGAPELREYPTPVAAKRTGRGAEVTLQMPVGIAADDVEKALARGGRWISIDGVRDIVAEQASPGRVTVRAVTRDSFEQDLGGDFL